MNIKRFLEAKAGNETLRVDELPSAFLFGKST